MLNLIKFLNDNKIDIKNEDQTKAIMNTIKVIPSYDWDMNCVLFKYTIDADFSNPIVKECRGIILYINTMEVACYPFNKFGNYGEFYADKINWNKARVQEKIDGSIIKVWWHKYKKEWIVSTNGTCNAKKSHSNGFGVPFRDLFDIAAKNQNLNFEKLDKNKTYMFELVSPYAKIVLDYPNTELYHIGTRDINSYKECEENIGIQKPKLFDIHSLEEAMEFNKDSKEEGFVVVDNNWNRIKVKTPYYLQAHYCINNLSRNPNKVLDFVLNGDADEILAYAPNMKDVVEHYKTELNRVLNDVENEIQNNWSKWKNEEISRKEYALRAQKSKYTKLAFMYLDDKKINNIHLKPYIETYNFSTIQTGENALPLCLSKN